MHYVCTGGIATVRNNSENSQLKHRDSATSSYVLDRKTQATHRRLNATRVFIVVSRCARCPRSNLKIEHNNATRGATSNKQTAQALPLPVALATQRQADGPESHQRQETKPACCGRLSCWQVYGRRDSVIARDTYARVRRHVLP